MADQSIPDVSLHGAVDLSSLAQPQRETSSEGASTTVEVTQDNLQELAERSMQVPVLINLTSAASPACAELTSRLETVVAEYGGKFVLGTCNIDIYPAIAQAFQVQAVPAVVALIGGRPAPLFQGNADDGQIRDVLNQVLEVAAQAGLSTAGEAAADDEPAAEPEEEPLPPLHQEAYDAIERDDFDGAIAAYEQALKENPKDADAKAGLAQVRLMARTRDLDLQQARQAAADEPADIDAQLAVADLDVAGGKIEDGFLRLIDVVRTTSGDDRERVRQRLVELFDVVGGEDPRVIKARQSLATTLY